MKLSKHGAISVGVGLPYFKRDEATGDWRRLHRKKPHELHSPSNIIRVIRSRRMRWVGQVAREGERTGAYRILAGKTEGKRSLGKLWRRGENNIEIQLKKIDGEVDRNVLAQKWDRSGSCERGDKTSGSIN